MGEIADDYINGACCSECMYYFEEEHGYPVLCKECWDENVEEGEISKGEVKEGITKNGLQRALYD